MLRIGFGIRVTLEEKNIAIPKGDERMLGQDDDGVSWSLAELQRKSSMHGREIRYSSRSALEPFWISADRSFDPVSIIRPLSAIIIHVPTTTSSNMESNA